MQEQTNATRNVISGFLVGPEPKTFIPLPENKHVKSALLYVVGHYTSRRERLNADDISSQAQVPLRVAREFLSTPENRLIENSCGIISTQFNSVPGERNFQLSGK